jgi:hypothetical protein
MITFKDFFLKENIHKGIARQARHNDPTKMVGTKANTFTKDGTLKSANIVANYYNKDDPNGDQNTTQKTGPLMPNEAEEYINDYKLNKNNLIQTGAPVSLGKRPFQIHFDKQSGRFMISKKTN